MLLCCVAGVSVVISTVGSWFVVPLPAGVTEVVGFILFNGLYDTIFV